MVDIIGTVLVALDNDDYFSNEGYSVFNSPIDQSLIGKQVFVIKDGQRISGKINTINASFDLLYPDVGMKFTKSGLLEISNLTLDPGDSGAPVLITIGESDFFLGMHIGGSLLNSYAIPANFIMSQFNLKP